jgi:hypothetical protein
VDDRLRRSRRQERDGARRYGGSANPQSGAGGINNDVRTPTESIEFKRTDADSYRLKAADLMTAWRHALIDGRRAGRPYRGGLGHATHSQAPPAALRLRSRSRRCKGPAAPT